VNSFSVIGSSHNLQTSIDPARVVNFTFDNILLPDSNVNEPASHGYVIYRIKGLASNPDPTSVTNTAHIYFDFNTAIVTNTTLTTFSDNFLGMAENSNQQLFELFPNPMSETAILKLKKPGNSEYKISIYDMAGRSIASPVLMKNGIVNIHKGAMRSGVYIIEALPVENGDTIRLKLIVK